MGRADRGQPVAKQMRGELPASLPDLQVAPFEKVLMNAVGERPLHPTEDQSSPSSTERITATGSPCRHTMSRP